MADVGGDWRDYLLLDDATLLAQCEMDRFRASGPGGQKRNKTDSAVRLRHGPTALTGESNTSRSQHENRARALLQLRRAIAQERRHPVVLDRYAPDALAPALGSGGRLRLGRRDRDYLPAIAELLDVLAAAEWRLGGAATTIGCSTGGLSRFLSRDPVLLARVNRARAAAGHRPLSSA